MCPGCTQQDGNKQTNKRTYKAVLEEIVMYNKDELD